MNDEERLLEMAKAKLEQSEPKTESNIDGYVQALSRIGNSVPKNLDTAVMGDDGLYRCKKCGGKRQSRITVSDNRLGISREIVVPCICKCMKEEHDEAQAKRAEFEDQDRISRLRSKAFLDQQMLEFTFAADDNANKKISDALKRYCENFPRFRREGKGVILYGSVGTGKSFLTACVVNELVSRGYSCQMTTFSRLTNQIGALWDGKQEFIDNLTQLSLIAIDDLGVERDTEYMNENVTTIVDALYTAKVPMIITSNYTPKQMTEEMDIRRKRIFDRILERCHPIEMTGESRRKQMGRNDYLEMKSLLGV